MKTLAILSLFFFQSSYAENCLGLGTKVFFANGMNNIRSEAKSSLDKLQFHYSSQFQSKNKIEYELAFNQKEDWPQELLQVFTQKVKDDTTLFWSWFLSVTDPPKWFADKMQELVQKYSNPMKYDSDFFIHEDKYILAINQGYNILIVSHSQGNFYANSALRELGKSALTYRTKDFPPYPSPQQLIQNVQVGTPVGATLNNSPHFNFPDDFLMAGIHAATRSLPSNLPSCRPDAGCTDFLGHNFERAYLGHPVAREKIMGAMNHAINGMTIPYPWDENLLSYNQDPDQEDIWVKFKLGQQVINGANERFGRHSEVLRCRKLQFGTIDITAFTVVGGPNVTPITHSLYFPYDGPARTLIFHPKYNEIGIRNFFSLGSIQVEKGTGQNLFKVNMHLLDQPKYEGNKSAWDLDD